VLWAIAGATFASTGGYGVGNFLGPHLVRHFGLGYALAGLVGGLIVGAPTLIGAVGGGFVSDAFGARDKRAYAWIPAAGLFFCSPICMFALTRSTWQSFLTVMLIGAIGQQFYLAPTFAVVNNAMDARMRATAIAFMSVCLNLIGLGFGPTLTGLLSDNFARALAHPAGADVLGLCVASAKGACDAGATGLQYAMIVMTGCYALGGVCFLVASLFLRRDLES
jgi:MFS family permease